MPKTFITKLKYTEKITNFNPGAAGAATAVVYSCNNLHDPSTTYGGHQPYGFDQLMTWYDHFVVLGSKIKVTFTNVNDTNNAYIVALGKNDDSTYVSPNMETVCESPFIKSTVMSNNASSRSVVTLTDTCSVKKYLGRSNVLSDPELKGSAASGPAEQAYYIIYASDMGIGDPDNLNAFVEIEYIAAFIEPKNVGGS